MTRLHTYLNFAGNAEEAFAFYRSVFGGEFSSVVRFKEFPIEGVSIPEEEQGGSCTSPCRSGRTTS
jgi:PhnB protein